MKVAYWLLDMFEKIEVETIDHAVMTGALCPLHLNDGRIEGFDTEQRESPSIHE